MNNLIEDLKYLSEMIIHGKRGDIPNEDHIEELDKEEVITYLDTKDEFGMGYTEYPEFEDEDEEDEY
jgi:hypothetical protein